MRSAQIKGGGERRNENSLRPQGRPNPIIPITPANHTLMMGIKMCWPRSSASARQASVQPSVSGFLRWWWWWAAGGRTSLAQVRSSVLVSAQRSGERSGSALSSEKKGRRRRKKQGAVGRGRTVCSHYTVFSFVTAPLAPFVAGSSREGRKKKKGLWFTPSYSTLKREQFNPLKLPSWLPSEPLQPFLNPPVKRTDIVQMYPNQSCIQKGVYFKKEKSKRYLFFPCSLFFHSLQKCVFFFVFFFYPPFLPSPTYS